MNFDPIHTFNTTVTAISRLVDRIQAGFLGNFKDTSMTSVTKLTQVEPLTIISQDCMHDPELPTIMHSLCSMFSSYYLQAVSILTTQINNVEVVRILDRLNPDRDSTALLLESRKAIAAESIGVGTADSFKYRLPTVTYAMEASDDDKFMDNSKVLQEQTNLAVGKVLNVSISVDETDGEGNATGKRKSAVVPVNVRLMPAFLNDESIGYIFTHKKEDQGIVERYYAWRAGRIEFIRDLILAQDLINEFRRAVMRDNTGTLREIVRRVTNSRTFGILTKNPSLATASNLYVLSRESAKAIEAKTGLRFDNAISREKIFEGTYAMIIAIYDSEWGQVQFYFNGLARPATFPIKTLKSASTNKGPDIADIMKSLMEGRAPTF